MEGGVVEEEGADGYCRWKAVPWQWPAARGGGDLGACGGEETGSEARRVKLSQSLTKIMEKNTKIYDIKYVYYENIDNKKSNDT